MEGPLCLNVDRVPTLRGSLQVVKPVRSVMRRFAHHGVTFLFGTRNDIVADDGGQVRAFLVWARVDTVPPGVDFLALRNTLEHQEFYELASLVVSISEISGQPNRDQALRSLASDSYLLWRLDELDVS